jgi:hypothetical protein
LNFFFGLSTSKPLSCTYPNLEPKSTWRFHVTLNRHGASGRNCTVLDQKMSWLSTLFDAITILLCALKSVTILAKFYVDLYKCGASSHYGSVDSVASIQGLSWISLWVFLPLEVVSSIPQTIFNIPLINLIQMTHINSTDSDDSDDELSERMAPKYHLHTHAPAAHIIYHLGKDALIGKNQLENQNLSLTWQHLIGMQYSSPRV